jgi:hypothetical protein
MRRAGRPGPRPAAGRGGGFRSEWRTSLLTLLTNIGAGNGYSLRWNLQKLIGEYARHNGHADLIRERIDGQTGE